MVATLLGIILDLATDVKLGPLMSTEWNPSRRIVGDSPQSGTRSEFPSGRFFPQARSAYSALRGFSGCCDSPRASTAWSVQHGEVVFRKPAPRASDGFCMFFFCLGGRLHLVGPEVDECRLSPFVAPFPVHFLFNTFLTKHLAIIRTAKVF